MLLELGFDLFDGVQTDADDDQQRGAAEREVLVGLEQDERHRRDQRDQRQVDRPGRGQPAEDVRQVLLRRGPGPDARDEPAVLLHVVGDLLGVEGDRHVEVGEEDDQDRVRDDVDRVRHRAEVLAHPLRRRAGRPERGEQHRQVEHRRGEDDRDDAGLVDLDRDVRRGAAAQLAADHLLGVLHPDPPLALLDEDHGGHHGQADQDHQAHHDQALLARAGLAHRGQAVRELGGDRGEDQHGHAVADALLGDQLTEPHHQAGAGGHRQDHHDDREQTGVVHQTAAAGDQLVVDRQGDERGRLHDRQQDRQVAGVLGDLLLALATLLAQRLQPRDHHGEQLQDDRGGDVGHHTEGEDRQLQQRPAGEHVQHRGEAGRPAGRHRPTGVDLLDVDVGDRDRRSEPEDDDDPQREEDLVPKIGCPEGIGECGEHRAPLLYDDDTPGVDRSLPGPPAWTSHPHRRAP
ncbi:hypothetical protein SDC9_72360 [bioreactor metagenome]|uniref:Uncharacterized protein n=1 Tax=bioreactor metagenome TaxID=1076179 RepID=A0A644YBI7_9ZZZZ